jgi:hypothetical protein
MTAILATLGLASRDPYAGPLPPAEQACKATQERVRRNTEPSVQPSLFAVPSVDVAGAADTSTERLVICSVESLKPPPALVRHGLLPTPAQLLALENVGESFFERALLITQDYLIIDGLEIWLIAQQQGRPKLLCQICLANAEEALLRILQLHLRPRWLNPFNRVQLALDLEPWLRERALANQVAGGKGKALSKLTEAEKRNCRKELSRLSGVCESNVDKVRKILDTSIPELIAAAQCGDVNINQARKLSKLSRDELHATLASRRSKKRSQATRRRLLSSHDESEATKSCLRELGPILKKMKAVPRLCFVWDRLAELLDAIDRELSEDRDNPHEQEA